MTPERQAQKFIWTRVRKRLQYGCAIGGKPGGNDLDRPSQQRQEIEAWVLSTLGRAVAYATSLTGNRNLAEDIVQDCYCRLLQKQGVYDLIKDGMKLLYRSISNASINLQKREQRYQRLEDWGQDYPSHTGQVPDTRHPEPADIALHHELEAVLASGLAKLPVTQRAALELKSLGHSQNDIAEMLEITSTHAGVLIFRARQALARHLSVYQESCDL